MNNNLFEFEEKIIKQKGSILICGVDEAGRGSLAGPVSACAVVPDFSQIIPGINDSKKLSESQRNRLYHEIIGNCYCYKNEFVSSELIDEINILNATKVAMKKSILSLFPAPGLVLIDAVKLDIGLRSQTIVHGDAISYSIACASIITKVERDKLMLEYANTYPEYGFEKHKGYGTKYHIEMIKKYGPCPIHRKSFISKFI